MLVRALIAVLMTTSIAAGQRATSGLEDSAPKRVRVSSGVMAGRILTKSVPKGEPDWCLGHHSNTVIFSATIGKDGRIKELSPLSGSAMVKAYATESIRQWTYRPYEVDGEPVEVETTITVHYQWGTPPPVVCKTTSEGLDQAEPVEPGRASKAQAPVRISEGVMQEYVVKKVAPTLPQEAREAHVNGLVVCHVLIGKDGRVKSIQVVSGPDLLRDAYMDAFRQWVYRPYLVNGEAVEVDTTISFTSNVGGL